MRTGIDSLIEAARLAPSGDNTQPWDFFVDRSENRITVRSNPSRDPSPMNAGDRMSRIAIGAALENMLQTASENRWENAVEIEESSVSVRLSEPYTYADLPPALRDRVSNRRKYPNAEIPLPMLELLRKAVAEEGHAKAHWISDQDARAELCELIAAADSIMLSNEELRRAFLAKVRFDSPATKEVDEGLSLGSLELSRFERTGLRVMRWMPDTVLKLIGVRRTFRLTALKLAGTASGFCVITHSKDSAESDYEVGRLFQRSWLALAEHGMAAQPMMSLLVLRNIMDNGSDHLKQRLGTSKIRDLLQAFSARIGAEDQCVPSAMLRFGQAPAPTSRTGRLPIETLVARSVSW